MQATNTSWIERNWKWVLPGCGCLGMIAALILFGGFFITIFAGTTMLMRSSEPYVYTMKKVSHNPAIIKALGSPIESEGMLKGKINTSGTSGDVDMTIPIHGPKGEAKVFIHGKKFGGKWEYDRFMIQLQGQEINLLK